MFTSALNAAAEQSNWVRWLVTSNSGAANETRAFLETAFINIRVEKQNEIAARIRDDNASRIEATIHELVAHELLRRLQLRPVFEPKLQGKTPDLLFQTAGARFISDVFVTHSPLKTVRYINHRTYEARDTDQPSESRADKIAKTLQGKAEFYASLGFPIVPLVFLGDRRALGFGDVEKACFGITLEEIALEAAFPENLPRYRAPVGGLFLPREDLRIPCENIPAVVSCDWFDTLNRQNPGKRLACRILHRWSARTPLPVEAFDPLPQVCWDHVSAGGWQPRFTTEPNLVLQFLDTDQIRVRQYSANAPW